MGTTKLSADAPIWVESECEGNIFELEVADLAEARKVRDAKISDGATNVRILTRLAHGEESEIR